jgi:hypothetical protein
MEEVEMGERLVALEAPAVSHSEALDSLSPSGQESWEFLVDSSEGRAQNLGEAWLAIGEPATACPEWRAADELVRSSHLGVELAGVTEVAGSVVDAGASRVGSAPREA